MPRPETLFAHIWPHTPCFRLVSPVFFDQTHGEST